MSHAGAGLLLPGGALEISILSAFAILLMAAGAWVFLGSRMTAAQRERRRRLAVNRIGRMGDATVIDVRGFVLFYSYEIRGVAYATSQDVSEFNHLLPPETSHLIGPVEIKYSPKNPANSIVICERWIGLRSPTPQFHAIKPKEKSRP